MQPLITTAPEAGALAARLSREPRIALDTEFLRERTYRAQLCLLQLSSDSDAACVDPLAVTDLASLTALLTSSSVTKVMHASRQDLEVLLPVVGLVRPVFDTQVAASLAGFPAQVGYAELVRRLLGHELAKLHTRTDWSRRPLGGEQIEYALDDVRYLLPLAGKLEEELARLGRRDWLEEDLALLGDASVLTVEPEEAWLRIKGLRDLDPARERLARTLAAWRERTAARHDRPRGWILSDAVLRDIVLQVPRNRAALAQIPAIPPAVVKRRSEELLECVRTAEVPDPTPPLAGRARPDPTRAALIRKLTDMSQAVARELQLAPEVLATRRELEQLVAGARDITLLRGWRSRVLGERLLASL